MDREEMITPGEAARILGVSTRTLARWKSTGSVQIDHVCFGQRVIRYRKQAVLDMITDGSSSTEAAAKIIVGLVGDSVLSGLYAARHEMEDKR